MSVTDSEKYADHPPLVGGGRAAFSATSPASFIALGAEVWFYFPKKNHYRVDLQWVPERATLWFFWPGYVLLTDVSSLHPCKWLFYSGASKLCRSLLPDVIVTGGSGYRFYILFSILCLFLLFKWSVMVGVTHENTLILNAWVAWSPGGVL